MLGFMISNIFRRAPEPESMDKVSGSMDVGNSFVSRCTLNKFMDDKVFFQDEEGAYITEGVILNTSELKREGETFSATVKRLWKEDSDGFFGQFRGSFSGAVFDCKAQEWIVYTNQIGDKPIFYFVKDGQWIIASRILDILDAMRELNIGRTANEQAFYNILTYGFMPDEQTYACEIKRLCAGQRLRIDALGNIAVERYHRFRRDELNLTDKTEKEIIDEMNKLFQRAVSMEYDKDKEYGLRHLTDLSGGLDSRMNVWVAHELGYGRCVNVTYCQSNYLDEIIAKQIAASLGNECIVRTLDDAAFLYDIDSIVRMNGGLALFSGITGGKRLLDTLDMRQFGVEHTGQIGDSIVGTHLQSGAELKDMEPDGLYSKRFVSHIDENIVRQFENKEEYLTYTRYFMGALSTHMIRQHYTEVATPFLDVDFVNYCYSIPIEMRIGHKLYKKWIMDKYPEAAEFKWEKIQDYITTPYWLCRVKQICRHAPGKVMRILKRGSGGITGGMNPMDLWLKKDKELQKYWNEYYTGHIGNRMLSDTLREDIKSMWASGNALEKTQVLTALAACDLYFDI